MNANRVSPRPAHARAGSRNGTSAVITDALRAGIILASDEELTETETSRRLRVAASAELLSCGYLATPGELAKVAPDTVAQTVRAAQALVGADRHWAPLFPDFPNVSNASSSAHASAITQVASQYVAGTPVDVTLTRPSMGTVLESATRLTLRRKSVYLADRMATLLATPVGLSQDDADVMALLAADEASQDPNAALARLAEISHGENQATYARALVDSGVDVFPSLAAAAKNPDALLRAFLSAYSEPSAPEHTVAWHFARLNAVDSTAYAVKITRVPRQSRRLLTAVLGDITSGYRADSLVTSRGLWRRVIRACHSYEFSPNDATRRALDIITENIEHRTLNSSVEQALSDKDVDTVRVLLAQNRPGQLLRRAVTLAQMADDDAFVRLCEAVGDASALVPLTTSLSAYDGVQAAVTARPRLTRSVHGGAHLDATLTTPLASCRADRLAEAIQAGVTARLAKTTDAPTAPVPVGGDQPLSLIRRDAGSTSANLTRGGAYTPAGQGETLRFLCHWYGEGVDLDLGATVMTKDFATLSVATWNSYDQNSLMTYSGDMTSAPLPDGASEFIDVDLSRVASELPNARYLVCSVYSYSGEPMNQVDHIVSASLTDHDTALFEPTQATTSGTSVSSGTALIPMVYDLTIGKFIWLDLDPGWSRSGGSVAHDPMLATLLAAEMNRPRLGSGEVAAWYAAAHGAAVDQTTCPDDALVDRILAG